LRDDDQEPTRRAERVGGISSLSMVVRYLPPACSGSVIRDSNMRPRALVILFAVSLAVLAGAVALLFLVMR
jgi:hypothetical protein